MDSWVQIPENSDFTLANIPFGIFKHGRGAGRMGSRIGDFVIDLSILQENGFFDDIVILDPSVFYEEVLNPFIDLGKTTTNAVRDKITALLSRDNKELSDNASIKNQVLIPATRVQMMMPVKIGDYTDFYSSEYHASNVGKMFRGAENALLPNWKHMPVGYHGRASSIFLSGEPVIRPKGQYKLPNAEKPVFGPTQKLDFELELAFITGKLTKSGESISVERAEDYIFGFVLFNDWSARDIQAWEYVPLGPFLGKNFASTISPWIVTLEALAPFRVSGPNQNPAVLEYLQSRGDRNLDIELTVDLKTEKGVEQRICQTNSRYLYWDISQQLAHQTVNGCNINVGDVYASGTISGPMEGEYGSLLEISLNGKQPVTLADGSQRSFLEDGDTIILNGHAGSGNNRVGFGILENKVVNTPT